jgi:lipoprotein-anchoring transpeptidase ErfK/SrfK
MPNVNRRAIIRDVALFGVACLAGGCISTVPAGIRARYAPVTGEMHAVPAVNLTGIDAAFLRADVEYATDEEPGTIVVDPRAHYLYFIEPDGRARRYGVAVGGDGFAWSGVARVAIKREWPDWHPSKAMLGRRPELLPQLTQLPTGLGMPGGPQNPLGARALYLWQGNVDTLYRIHGTNEPWKIGTSTSSGCIRMINQDVIDLYGRASVGAKVVVLSTQTEPLVVGSGNEISQYGLTMRE